MYDLPQTNEPRSRRERRIHRALGDGPLNRDVLPVRVDRVTGAVIVSRLVLPVSARSLERWPVPTVLVNGKAIMETRALLDEAERRVAAAPAIRGGPAPRRA